jgi:hypothetical protein
MKVIESAPNTAIPRTSLPVARSPARVGPIRATYRGSKLANHTLSDLPRRSGYLRRLVLGRFGGTSSADRSAIQSCR